MNDRVQLPIVKFPKDVKEGSTNLSQIHNWCFNSNMGAASLILPPQALWWLLKGWQMVPWKGEISLVGCYLCAQQGPWWGLSVSQINHFNINTQ